MKTRYPPMLASMVWKLDARKSCFRDCQELGASKPKFQAYF